MEAPNPSMVCSAWDSEMNMDGSWLEAPGVNETVGRGAISVC